MKLFSLEENGFPKTILILAVIFLVSSGLCGLQLIVANSSGGSSSGWVLIPLGIAELIAMLLSAGGIVVVCVLWIASTVYGRYAHPDRGETLHIFEDSDSDSSTEEDNDR